MISSGPLAFDDPLREKSRRYKTEFLKRYFGMRASTASSEVRHGSGAGSVFSCIPRYGNIVGLGYGAKSADGYRLAGEQAIRVYVRTKLPKSALSRNHIIPSAVEGIDTDVIAVGDIVTSKRPIACGVSIGHVNVTAGTLGCLVRHPDNGGNYILSNNHVLANCDLASIGDHILEPGRMDGGNPNDPIGELTYFAPLRTGGTVEIDAALARVFDVNSVLPEIMEIGAIHQPSISPSVYQSVRKHGRTTLHTVGMVTDIDADIRVWYEPLESADFAS